MADSVFLIGTMICALQVVPLPETQTFEIVAAGNREVTRSDNDFVKDLFLTCDETLSAKVGPRIAASRQMQKARADCVNQYLRQLCGPGVVYPGATE